MRRLSLLIVLLGCLAALGVAGCGSSSSSSSVSSAVSSSAGTGTSTTGTSHVATAKFVLHAGLGFGAFHRYIYKPVKAGVLKNPLSHKAALVKAGLAAAFVYHELKLAAGDAKSSKLLNPVAVKIAAAAAAVKSLANPLRKGDANPSEIDNLNGELSQIKATAASNGSSISDKVPGLSQLASGATG
jgi:hypothetical protein